MILQKILNASKTTRSNIGPRLIQVPQRQAGVYVDHDTALQSAAVFACIRVIAQDIAQLPWNVFLRIDTNHRDRQPNNFIELLLNRRPNPETKAKTFRETLLLHAQTWGNGYAEIVRDRSNRPAELWQIMPDRVEVRRSRETGRLFYEVVNARQSNTIIDPKNMFHIQGMSHDGIVGMSVVSQAARSIGLNISLEEFGATFFGNGATLGGIIEIPKDTMLSDEAKINLKKTFNKTHQGPHNAHKVEVLDNDMKYKEVGIAPDKGQFTESRQNQVEEICRWFRVPPHKVGHLLRMTFNNVEKLDINYVQESLIPWMISLEQEADYKLFGAQNNRHYTKINAAALMRGDAQARVAFYRGMWDMGALSTNDILELEDRNGIGPEGDKRLVQMNLTTLEKAGEQPDTTNNPNPNTAINDDENSEDENDQDVVAHRTLICNQVMLLLERESLRVEDLRGRYKNRQEFIERVTGFLGSHKLKVIKSVRKCLDALERDTRLQDIDTQYAAEVYADKHIDVSRAQAIRIFDNEPSLDNYSRAKRVADQLISAIQSLEGPTHAGN